MAGEGINPFHYSSPVGEAELVDRDIEITQILDAAQSGNNSRLAAPRRYGKTSLLKAALAEADRQGFAVVYVDFFGVLSLADVAQRIEVAYASGLTGRAAQWFAAARRTLSPAVRLGGGALPAQVEVAGVAGRDQPLAERLALPLKLHARTGKRVLVAFDEFQDVLQASGLPDAVIRSQIQHHTDVAGYVFAGSHVGMMAELFGNKRRAFYSQARPISLPPLPAEDLGEHVASRFASSGKDVGDAVGPLLDAAGGHPQRSMLLAHVLWELTEVGTAAEEETWVAAYDRAMAESLDEIKTVWAGLPSGSRKVLTTVAEDVNGLYSRSSGQSRGGAVASGVRKLLDSGEIVEDTTTTTGYRVVDPLMASWIRSGRTQSGR